MAPWILQALQGPDLSRQFVSSGSEVEFPCAFPGGDLGRGFPTPVFPKHSTPHCPAPAHRDQPSPHTASSWRSPAPHMLGHSRSSSRRRESPFQPHQRQRCTRLGPGRAMQLLLHLQDVLQCFELGRVGVINRSDFLRAEKGVGRREQGSTVAANGALGCSPRNKHVT